MQFKTLQSTLLLLLVAAATALFVWLIQDFWQPVFWAIVLTIVFHPVYRYLHERFRERRNLAAGLTLVIILLVVLTPIYVLGVLVAKEALALYNALSSGSASWNGLDAGMQQIMAFLEPLGVETATLQERVTALIQTFSNQIGSYAVDAGRATVATIVGTFVTLYLLFFALRDGDEIRARIMHALPLGDRKEKMLFERFAAIVRAMFQGTFIIAVIQGLIGGVLFVIVGIPNAALWAFVMTLFALIPAVGPGIVWAPAAALLFASGNVWEAIVVTLVGVVIIGLIDNLLRPVLVGRKTAMPDALILLSVLGGLTLFGVSGIIIGPVIAAFFLTMWQLFEHDYAEELEKHG